MYPISRPHPIAHASSPFLDRGGLTGKKDIETQMADDLRVLATTAGGVTEDDLMLLGGAAARSRSTAAPRGTAPMPARSAGNDKSRAHQSDGGGTQGRAERWRTISRTVAPLLAAWLVFSTQGASGLSQAESAIQYRSAAECTAALKQLRSRPNSPGGSFTSLPRCVTAPPAWWTQIAPVEGSQ